MSDLGKAWREQMQAEASDELCAGEFEQFDFGTIGIVAIYVMVTLPVASSICRMRELAMATRWV